MLCYASSSEKKHFFSKSNHLVYRDLPFRGSIALLGQSFNSEIVFIQDFYLNEHYRALAD